MTTNHAVLLKCTALRCLWSPLVPETPCFLYDSMICCMDMLNSVFPGERLTSQALCAVLMFVESPSVIYRLNNGIPFEMAAQPPFSLFDITSFIETQDIQQLARSMTLPRPLDPWLSMWWTSQSAVDWDRGGWQLGTSLRRLTKPLFTKLHGCVLTTSVRLLIFSTARSWVFSHGRLLGADDKHITVFFLDDSAEIIEIRGDN